MRGIPASEKYRRIKSDGIIYRRLATAVYRPAVLIGRPFVKRFALCCRSVVCLFCLSVTLVYCGQTVGRIKMKLSMQVGLGPGHMGPSSHSPKRGRAPSPISRVEVENFEIGPEVGTSGYS